MAQPQEQNRLPLNPIRPFPATKLYMGPLGSVPAKKLAQILGHLSGPPGLYKG